MGVYLWTKKLPSTYQEVEYIKSSGRCRIATGFSPSGSYLKTVTKFKLDSLSVERGNTPFIYGYTTSNFCFLCRNGGSGTFEVGNGGGAKVTGVSVDTGTDYEIEIVANSGTQTININGTTESGSCGSSLSTGDLQLFCRYGDNIDGPGSEYGYFSTDLTIYSFQIYTSADTCVRDFVPCYRKSDSVIGMYDLVNDVFYTNQGTGTFIKGNDVAGVVENELKNAYIGEYPERWQPGADTIAYYPLTSSTTTTDSQGNYNLSNSGNVTFGTYNSVSCAYFDGTSTSKLYNSSISYNSYPIYTVNCRFFLDYSGSRYQTIYTIGNTYATGLLGVWYNYDVNGGSIALGAYSGGYETVTQISISTNTRHNLVVVVNGSSSKQYLDGTQIATYTNSLSDTQTGLNLGCPSHNSNDTLGGGISEFILENKVWTNEDIENYYNKTKGDYGIS